MIPQKNKEHNKEMKISEKIMMDIKGLEENGPINIVICGDSVSHGAFNGYMDYEKVYWNVLKKKMYAFRDFVPINMINVSIGGTVAKSALGRFDRQVLIHQPDLVIICFGLNDVNGSLESYIASLRAMFEKCNAAGVDAIFMTPNMLNTRVADDAPKEYYNYAIKTADMQNNGKMDQFMTEAVALAKSMNITVCDCYSKWKELSKTQDVTMLLCNRINHPTEEMHLLFADSLYKVILGDTEGEKSNESTMYKE